MATIQAPQYHDEEAAREYLEANRWPDGPVCPHCGVIGDAYELGGKTTRKGLYKCKSCREPFTVTIGTIFEDSHIPLHKWLLAIHLMCSSKKGISAHQLWRNLWDVDPETGKQTGSYRTAWFMAHRIRWAFGQQPVASKMAGVVEIDECYIGGRIRTTNKPQNKPQGEKREKRQGPLPGTDVRGNKAAVVSILQRDGEVRSKHVERVTAENLRPMIEDAVEASAHIMTDTSTVLQSVPREHKHSTVNHTAKEYVRHEEGITISTNTVEGYFSILKRGINGIYHHVGKHYLDQYLREFDFRYNVRPMNDTKRIDLALKKSEGTRLMLKQPKNAE